MTIDQRPATAQKGKTFMISFSLLGGLVIAFLLGFAAHSLGQNIGTGGALSFSTPELISFVLSVLLSGASIFLAVSAIALGKFSEQAMIQRSDESIRLQNEVFQKTTEALQRIESSTGVTEKRIEDIISGRVGDLSQKIARIASEKQEGEGGVKPQEIEEMIRRSLMESIEREGVLGRRVTIDENLALMNQAEKVREEQQAQYKQLHGRLLTALSMRDDLKALKMGDGRVDGAGDDLFDGIYLRKDGKRIGILDFAAVHKSQSVRKATFNSLLELQKGNIAHVYIVVFGAVEPLERAFAEGIAVASPDLKSKITYTVCSQDEIEETMSKLPIADN